jgi:hypothetical protein
VEDWGECAWTAADISPPAVMPTFAASRATSKELVHVPISIPSPEIVIIREYSSTRHLERLKQEHEALQRDLDLANGMLVEWPVMHRRASRYNTRARVASFVAGVAVTAFLFFSSVYTPGDRPSFDGPSPVITHTR